MWVRSIVHLAKVKIPREKRTLAEQQAFERYLPQKNVRLLNMKRREFGTMGEDLAVEFLKNTVIRLCVSKFLLSFWEVDIIATDTGINSSF